MDIILCINKNIIILMFGKIEEMAIILSLIILGNLICFQWALVSSILKGKKINAMLDKTLSKSVRLKMESASVISIAFYKSAVIA